MRLTNVSAGAALAGSLVVPIVLVGSTPDESGGSAGLRGSANSMVQAGALPAGPTAWPGLPVGLRTPPAARTLQARIRAAKSARLGQAPAALPSRPRSPTRPAPPEEGPAPGNPPPADSGPTLPQPQAPPRTGEAASRPDPPALPQAPPLKPPVLPAPPPPSLPALPPPPVVTVPPLAGPPLPRLPEPGELLPPTLPRP